MAITQEESIKVLSQDRANIADLVKRLGHPPSVILLDPACHYFMLPHIEGFIGYRLESRCAVVIGEPVCSQEDLEELTRAFHLFCEKQRWSIIYMLASESFAKWALQDLCQASVQVAEELIIDPEVNPMQGRKGEKLRWKVNNSRQNGVTIEEYRGGDPRLEAQLNQVVEEWLKTKKGPQIYLGHVDLFANRIGTRWFYARKDRDLLGVLMLKEVDIHSGWVMHITLALQGSPAGTSENLIMSVIEQLRSEECAFLSLGASPGKELGAITGMNPFSCFLARYFFKMANWFFKLQARKTYFKKFLPKTYPAYVLFSSAKIRRKEIKALMKALNISL